MSIEIRPIGQDEVDDYSTAVSRGFHRPVANPKDAELRRERWLEGRWWAAFDGASIVATVRTLPLETTMQGGAPVVSCAVTAVTTAASHRRRGIMSQLMAAAIRDGRERGEPITSLIAAEYPIYGRFGFGPSSEHASYTFHLPARWRTEPCGTVEMADGPTFLELAPAIYDRHRRQAPTELARDSWSWQRTLEGWPSEPRTGFQAIVRDGHGKPSGYVMYTVDSKFEHRRAVASLKVEELIAADPAAEHALWQFVAGVDWVRSVTANDRSVDERLGWWLDDARDMAQTSRSDFVWTRPLDTAEALAARSYSAPLDLVISVVDPLELSGGTFRLTANTESATCRPVSEPADITVPMFTLGAILFGGFSLRTLAAAGRADEHTPGAIARVDAAFRGPATPWSATWF
jgi:predicted acetyltransferase